MAYDLTLMTEAEAREVMAWRYDGPFAVYTSGAESEAERAEELAGYLDRRSPHYAARVAGERAEAPGPVVGFFCYGSGAEVVDVPAEPRLYSPDGSITIGLGLRPDLTGKGLGVAFTRAGMDFCRERYAPRGLRLFVLAWNIRAITVYERVGFQRVRNVTQRWIYGEREFVEMYAAVQSAPSVE